MKFDKDTLSRWRAMARAHLTLHDESLLSVTTGLKAWNVAHRCGITREAYADRSVTDAHIQTALERIFPNAVFRDAKQY